MMASACVTNTGVSPEIFLDCPPPCPSYSWICPRISFSRDLADDGIKMSTENPDAGTFPAGPSGDWREKPDPNASGKDLVDFEFRLDDLVTMLPADELFSGGKMVTLQKAAAPPLAEPADEIRSPEPEPLEARVVEFLRLDPSAPSPKAPRCSSRWRELLGLKRQHQQGPKLEHQKGAAYVPFKNPNSKSLKHFLHRNPKSSSTDPSQSLPLLRDADSESVSLSSHVFLSSTSGPDHEDLPRISHDSEKPIQVPIYLGRNPPRVRASRAGSAAARAGRSTVRRTATAARGASVDSPRMNSSGRVVFQGLERSSSSPSSFNGGPRVRHRGMERSYSAGVRITPVLNVPVFGLGQLFTPLKKERDGASAKSVGGCSNNNGSIRGKIERERA